MAADRSLAVVTGASSGIGRALAHEFVANGFDVVVCAEDSAIDRAAVELRQDGADVRAVRADLATFEGVESLVRAVDGLGRAVVAVAVTAGIGVGDRFIDRPLEDHLRLIALNVTGGVHLTWRLLRPMVERGAGRLLFTSSIAATMPGP
jgi:short-subunit dehydrogenase